MSADSFMLSLEKEKKKLETIINATVKRLEKAPKGSVRVINRRYGAQFYLRSGSSDKNGVYLPVSKRPLGIALIQKSYDKKLLAMSEKQLDILKGFMKFYDPDALKKIYLSCPDARKKYLAPADMPDEEYKNNWQAQEYQHKHFQEDTPEHYTSKGERVRSKSEVMIADALGRSGIPYRYECALALSERTIYPDFTILRVSDRKEMYWEHLEKMDDPEYCSMALGRIRLYEENGLALGTDLIITMEMSDLPINLSVIKRTIKMYCL